MNNAPMEPFLRQDEVSVKAVLLGPFLTLEPTPVPNAPQEHFRFVAAPYASDARQAHFLLQEVASVAIVLLESFLREKAGTAQNALRERSPRIQVALRARHVQLESMKLTSSFATSASRVPFQLPAVELAARAMLAVLPRML